MNLVDKICAVMATTAILSSTAMMGMAAYDLQTGKAATRHALSNAAYGSEYAEKVMTAAHENYIIGIHSGMQISGVKISDDLHIRMDPIIKKNADLRGHADADRKALDDLRAQGATNASDFTVAELDDYLTYVEGLSEDFANARIAHAAAFNDLPGISSGETLAKMAQAFAILGDDKVEGATAEEALKSFLKHAFDDDHPVSSVDFAALQDTMRQAIADIDRIALTDAALINAKASLKEHHTEAFTAKELRESRVLVNCPFDDEPNSTPDGSKMLSLDDACQPGG